MWKGDTTKSLTVLKAGDFFYAVLEPARDGLLVKELYANIVNHYGLVTQVNGNEIDIMKYRPGPTGQIIKVILGADTVINNGNGSGADIQINRFTQIVGVFLPTGRVLATRMWVYKK